MKLMRMFRRFARATGGQAALEFAILAPFVMVPLLMGSFDLLDLLSANRRAQNAAASIADVVSRDTEVTDAEVSSLWSAVDVLMYPNSAQGMQTRVTAIRVVSASSAVVAWSEGHNGLSALSANSPVTLRAAMMQPGTSVVMTETIYPYTSPLGFITPSVMSLNHTAYRRSRLVDPIPRVRS